MGSAATAMLAVAEAMAMATAAPANMALIGACIFRNVICKSAHSKNNYGEYGTSGSNNSGAGIVCGSNCGNGDNGGNTE